MTKELAGDLLYLTAVFNHRHTRLFAGHNPGHHISFKVQGTHCKAMISHEWVDAAQ